MNLVIFIARFTLLIVFGGALVGKLHSRAAWSNFVGATEVLLGVRGMAVAWSGAAATAEAATVCCLAVNRLAYVGLVLALVELTVFLGVVTSGVIRGAQTACNCFGADGASIGWTHVWRNLILVGVAALGVGAATASNMPSGLLDAAYATPTVVSVLAAAIFIAWDDFAYLVGRTES